MKYLLLISLILTVLNGCSQEEVDAANYVKEKTLKEVSLDKQTEYFKNHQDELKLQRNKCNKMPRQEFKSSSDCQAVLRAINSLGW